jgi:hypothetical protein
MVAHGIVWLTSTHANPATVMPQAAGWGRLAVGAAPDWSATNLTTAAGR